MKNSAALFTSSTLETEAGTKTSKVTAANGSASISNSLGISKKLNPVLEGSEDSASQNCDDDEEYSTPLRDTTNDLNSTFTKEKQPFVDRKAPSGMESHPPAPTNPNSKVTSTAASTCTPMHKSHYHLMAGSALATTLAAKSETQAGAAGVNNLQSYAMTPTDSDPLHAYENYDIGNLSSDDSTDEEDCPKKVRWCLIAFIHIHQCSQLTPSMCL